ncbi:uncharacterized protein [Procambarus clarkii]|uniref:uncharacterized protein n=1 Tax=Procambarus clarkii TaxID=6728 RepID=UPI001E670E65|nr:uncharacterized protein LOC123746342 [Procambarus clarkii]
MLESVSVVARMGKVAGQHLLLVLLVLLAHGHLIQGSVQCYTCTSDANNLYCVNEPDNVANGSPITDCHTGEDICCTITRQEYLESPGQIVSFSRSCQPNCPKDGFTPVKDLTQVNYKTYCRTPKCNIGPGNKPLSGGGGGGDDGNSIHNIPGTGGTSSTTTSLTLLIAATALALLPRL